MSMTSAARVSFSLPSRKPAATSPALLGVTAYTAEWIFTPAGMPSTGTLSPIASQMFRAVPSPPAKRIKLAPAATISAAAVSVSSGVVSPLLIEPITVVSRPAFRHSSSPISAG